MKNVIYIVKKIRCLFGNHEPVTAFSCKTGDYCTVCNVCGKTLAKSKGVDVK